MEDSKPKILAVDDSNDNLKIITKLFAGFGFDVVTEKNPIKALELYGMNSEAINNFKLIITDIYMPNMHGGEFVSTVKQRGFKGPVVAFTSYPTMTGKKECEHAGVAHYLSKTTLKKEVIEALLRQYGLLS